MRSFAYVMQDNVYIGLLTVRESLYYAAELRLSEKMSAEDKKKRVDKIINMLGLEKQADTILGTSFRRGVSGGQLKRVSIGVEIINLPDLMFLDEPTTGNVLCYHNRYICMILTDTIGKWIRFDYAPPPPPPTPFSHSFLALFSLAGLDSSISLEVMSAVRNLANQNRTVICTIHQPSPETFALFDTLLLLAEGRVIYFGPTSTMIQYFQEESPYQFPYKKGSNAADYVVAVAGSFITASDGSTISGQELADYYTTTDRYQAAQEIFAVPGQAAGSATDNPLLNKDSQVSGVCYAMLCYAISLLSFLPCLPASLPPPPPPPSLIVRIQAWTAFYCQHTVSFLMYCSIYVVHCHLIINMLCLPLQRLEAIRVACTSSPARSVVVDISYP